MLGKEASGIGCGLGKLLGSLNPSDPHGLGKTELNYQRALKKTVEKTTGGAEKLYVFYIAAHQREYRAFPCSNRVHSIKVICPKQN